MNWDKIMMGNLLYLDPASLSFVMQAIIGVFIALGVGLKLFWAKIKFELMKISKIHIVITWQPGGDEPQVVCSSAYILRGVVLSHDTILYIRSRRL